MTEDLERVAARIADGDAAGDTAGLGPLARNLERIDAIARAFRDDGASAEAVPRLFQWRHLDVETVIGEGGFGTVYRAWDPVLKRHVALKLAQPERSGVPDDLLIAEARRMARVRHPNVLAIHGGDRDGAKAGIWADLIEGSTFKEIVAAEGPLPLRALLPVAERLCDALVLIHQRGITHGDIKPANVMLRTSGEPVLMDFGAGQGFYGSPLVMAPEMFEDIRSSFAADVYAMGTLLYFLLTGRYPVEAESFDALSKVHERGAVVDFGAVPRSIRALLRACLARSPMSRPTSGELLSSIRFLLDAPDRRKRRMVGGTVVLSLTVALVATGAGLWRTSEARQQAELDRAQAESSLLFLTDMLAAPRLSEHGSEVKVVDMLEEAARHLEARQLGDEQASRLHVALAQSHASLEDYEPARRHFEQALELTEDPARKVAIIAGRLELERSQSHVAQADAQLEALAAFVARHGRDLPAYLPLYVTFERGMTAVFKGEQAAAWPLLEAVDSAPVGLPPEHAANFRLWSALSNLYRDEAQLDQALHYAEKSLRWHVEHGDGEGSFNAVQSRQTLATVMAVARRFEEAEMLSRQNLELLDAIDSRWSHMRMAVTLVLIETLVEQGRAEEAVQRLEALLERARLHIDSPHRSLLTIIGQLGPAHFELGQYAQAEAATREALAMADRLMGPDSSRSRLYRSNIAEFMLYQNRGPQVLSYARETYEKNVALYGETHLFSLFMADVYGAAEARWGDAATALALLDETLARKRAQFGDTHAFTWDTQKSRVEALRAAGQAEAARGLAERTYRYLTDAKGADFHKTRAVAALLAELRD